MTSMTRGPLPARVYWTRRLLLLAVVVGLVLTGVGVVKVAGGDPSPPDQAQLAGSSADVRDDPVVEEPDDEPTGRVKNGRGEGDGPGRSKRKKDRGPVLASPEGPCVDRDIAVTPTARTTVAGGPVTFTLQLRSILSAACTWEVSPDSLTVKIRSGDDDIWFSTDCRRSIPSPRRRAAQQRHDRGRGDVVGPPLRRRVYPLHRLGDARAGTSSRPPRWPASRPTCTSS